MTLTIYGDQKSGNCLKVKWVCERLGLAFRWLDVDIMRSETRTPEFLLLNPAGQVPVVVLADGRALAQSNAIIWHLAEGSPLIPSDPYDRARMIEWLFWEQYSHEPYIGVARFQMRYLGKNRDELDPQLFIRGDKALDRLESGLSTSPYLVGRSITLADIALVAYTRMAGDGGFDLTAYPAVLAWVECMESALPIQDPR